MRSRWKDGFPRISTSRRTWTPSQASRVPWRTWRQRRTSRSVPMPSLPRIRRTRPRGFAEAVAPRAEPRVAELSADGLTWIHLDPPIDPETVNSLRERFGWHPDDIEDRRSEEIVTDISKVKQEIISYRKIIKPQRPALRLLERHIERFLPEELELYFDDLVDASERIWDLLDNYKEVVEALESTNESVISHRQNDVLRILTVFSVILLPLTLISGIFGMNVNFPGEATRVAFWAIVGLMVAVIVGMIGFFKYKRWL